MHPLRHVSSQLGNVFDTHNHYELMYNWHTYYRHTQKAEELIKAQQAKKQAHQPASQSQSGTGQSPGASGDATDDGQQPADWTYDPNEPRYCVCNQVSYGEMVGCDNPDVRRSSVVNVYNCMLYVLHSSGVYYCDITLYYCSVL